MGSKLAHGPKSTGEDLDFLVFCGRFRPVPCGWSRDVFAGHLARASMTEDEAIALAVTLRGMATTIKTTLVKTLQGKLASDAISLDKSGHEVQTEAMQLALLMSRKPPTEKAGREMLDEIRSWKANPQVASFLQVRPC